MRVLQTASETLNTRYFHTDHLGSISVITDENGGSRAFRARTPGVIARWRDPEHVAQNSHRIVGPEIFDEAELHF